METYYTTDMISPPAVEKKNPQSVTREKRKLHLERYYGEDSCIAAWNEQVIYRLNISLNRLVQRESQPSYTLERKLD